METQNVTIERYGSGGEGVARLSDGRVVFVRGGARGDEVEIRITKEQPRSARAEISRIITPSPHRIEPDCKVYPECGGCDFRHITYEEELDLKLRRINDALERIGGLTIRAEEILTTGQVDGYRNKVTLHSDGTSLGFYKPESHEVVPIETCRLLKDDLNEAVGKMVENNPLRAVGSRFKADKVACEKVAPRESADDDETASDKNAKVVLRSGKNGMEKPLEEELDGLTFQIKGFFQVNTDATLLLCNKAREYAGMAKDETLIDLYCGIGTFTLFVGRDAGRALGVESNPNAVNVAKKNAQHNKLDHIDFVEADAGEINADVLNLEIAPDCVIVDPPRKGLSQGAVREILQLKPKRIIYISCDPATLARDLKRLEGYEPKEICAIDMFPRTANVEICCLLNFVDTPQ